MCIRDSLGKDDFYTQVLNAYAEKQAAKTTYTLSVIKLSELSRADVIIDGLIEPVSYTHLDVYKRQTLTSPAVGILI